MSKKRYLKAVEVEEIFNKARSKDADFTAGEVSIIKTLIENAKRTGNIGDKILLVIPPHYIHIPEWQRNADLANATNIGANYNRYKWDIPKIIIIKGKIFCIDGMHRILGALLAGITSIVVEVLEITEEEAINIFLCQGIDRNNMKPKDYYKPSIKVNKPDYIAFRDICHKYNVQVNGDDTLDNPVGTFTPLTDGVRIDKPTLDRIMNLINRLSWNGKETSSLNASNGVYSAKVIRSLKKIYAYYANNVTEMENILIRNCMGTTWYIENLSGMPQYVIFDTLNKTILREMEQKVINSRPISATSRTTKKSSIA